MAYEVLEVFYVAYREFPEDIPCSNRREGKIITLKITEMTRNTMTKGHRMPALSQI
jgi:hypothetical protein